MNVNAGKAVNPENLGDTLVEMLINWSNSEEQKFFDAIDDAAKACNDTAKSYLSKGHGVKTGDYRDHFAIESEMITKHHKRATWHVKSPEYRLTHLLENGHLTRDGTKRTKKVVHIKHGRQIAEQVLDQKMNGLWEG